MIIFVFFTTEFQSVTFAKQTLKSHCKIDGSCCTTPSPAHEFCYRHQCYETTNEVVKLLGIPKDNTARFLKQETNGFTSGCSSEQNARKEFKKLAVTPAFVSD
jgi:ferrochelatase